MLFGKNFRNIRKGAHLTQKEVAEKLGICQSNISDWENDISRPEYENLLKLRDLYDVTLDELLNGEEEPFRTK